MRRELSLVGVSLVAYACALVLGSLVICGAGHASELVGEWATQGNAAHVRVERCSTAPDLLCGFVTWLWEPIDAAGEAIRDEHNPDPRLRSRPVVGLSLLEDFRRGVNGEPMEGRIYNPENGRTYRASLRLRSPDVLEAMHPKQIRPDLPLAHRSGAFAVSVRANSMRRLAGHTGRCEQVLLPGR